jgi:acyl-[acyl-carrier-protein]-phospholipid O-acyltransferase/long-chain-fatty-acid--[acyl-carrier-protein] ligase
VPAIFGYFLLAVQSTLFSPAKQGILKEIVGSSRLALANGLMQMLTMVGILGGIGLGGWWFDRVLADLNAATGVSVINAWEAAKLPIVYIGLGCVVPLLISIGIQRTPSHPEKTFEAAVFFRHFQHLGLLFKRAKLRGVALKIALYWFVANSMALVFIAFGKELFPDTQEGGATSASSIMLLCVGVGLIFGSTLVSILSRHRIQLKLIPLGAIGMATGLLGIALFDPAGWTFKISIGVVGFSSGFFIVPLTAWLQDLAPEDERGRIISASNLISSLAGVFAIVTCNGLDSLGVPASGQIVLVLVLMVLAFVWTFPYLKKAPDA